MKVLQKIKCFLGFHKWEYEGDTLMETGYRHCLNCERLERGFWISKNGYSTTLKWFRTFDRKKMKNHNRQILNKSGLKIWKNKTLDKMSDQDCKECVSFLWNRVGVTYVLNENLYTKGDSK